MKHHFLWPLIPALLAACVGIATAADQDQAVLYSVSEKIDTGSSSLSRSAGDAWGGLGDLVRDRVEVGTRVSWFSLSDDKASGPGTIEKLDDNQEFNPFKLFIDVMVNEYWGFELTYDKVAADAIKGSGASDGEITMSGPIVTVQGRYPNASAFTPYAGIGFAFWGADFDESAFWRFGYDGPEEYAAAGSPGEPRGGRTRNMSVDDDTGIVLQGGCLWEFLDGWFAEFFLRHTDVSSKATFVGRVNGRRENSDTATFDLTHISYGLGVRKAF